MRGSETAGRSPQSGHPTAKRCYPWRHSPACGHLDSSCTDTHVQMLNFFIYQKKKIFSNFDIHIYTSFKKLLERDGGCLQCIQSFTVQCVSPQRTHWVDVCTDDFCNAPCEKVPYDDAAIVAANGQKGAPAVKCAGEGHADTVQGAICLLTTQIRRHN